MNIFLLNGGPKKAGATAEIVKIVKEYLSVDHSVKDVCLGECNINYCLGCKQCDITGDCVQNDDTLDIVKEMYAADAVVVVVPSYWADVPGQMKVFIDRCTPYSNTNPKRREIAHSTKGHSIVLRTGNSPAECEGIIHSINHFYGHMEIEQKASTYFCGIQTKADIVEQSNKIMSLCEEWFKK